MTGVQTCALPICIIDTLVEEHYNQHMQEKLNESLEDIEEGFFESPIGLATLQSWKKVESVRVP